MKLHTSNLEQELFSSLRMCEGKIIIVSPYISFNTAEMLVEITNEKQIECKVITKFERKDFIEKSSSLKALKLLVESDIQVLAMKELHTKLYIIDGKCCFVGSANFTHKGLNVNHELLLYIDNEYEVQKINDYADNLLLRISDWKLTMEQIKNEQGIVDVYKKNQEENEQIMETWGADLKMTQTVNEDAVVLSVPAGGTIHLIDKYLVHAHPISRGYNYSSTNHITFRRKNGGVMDKVYQIDKTLELEMDLWKSEIGEIGICNKIEERLTNYIVDRYRDFEFDKAPRYKFYILSLYCELPNEPHPPANNAGGWLYNLKNLQESTDYVHTIRQMESVNTSILKR